MEKVFRTGKVSGRLGLLNEKFLSRLAMLYGVADEPLNSTTTRLMSMQVRFAPILKILHKIMPGTSKKRASDLPRTTENLHRTCPGPSLKINRK